jgi:hypothetical protein
LSSSASSPIVIYPSQPPVTASEAPARPEIHEYPETFASSGKSVGDGERQRAVAVRNRRNFLQVESKDLC